MWILPKLNFWKCEICQNWVFEYVTSAKIDFLKMWILSQLIYSKCEFCENWVFEYVNFAKIEFLNMWILWKLRLWIYEFCQNWVLENVNFVSVDIFKMWILRKLSFWTPPSVKNENVKLTKSWTLPMNFSLMNSHNSLSTQLEIILRVPPIHLRHLGHLRVDTSKSFSKHSRHMRWLQRSLTGSFTMSRQIGQSKSSAVSWLKSRQGRRTSERRRPYSSANETK